MAPDDWDYTNTLLDTFGPYDDNGTLPPPAWGAPELVYLNYHYFTWNCTYYMFTDDSDIRQLAYNKIPATFSKDSMTGQLLAYWNYSYYDMGYVSYQSYSRPYRWTSKAYSDGLWPLRPYVNIVIEVETGLTQSMEFDFGADSAWKSEEIYEGVDHPFTTQVKKLKIDLIKDLNEQLSENLYKFLSDIQQYFVFALPGIKIVIACICAIGIIIGVYVRYKHK
ncbi:MAG: hypothetical protein ACFFBD_11285 [Candidatus Hodarchaeota archaeon]